MPDTGLTITLRGKLDPSLAQSASQARSVALKLQTDLQKEIARNEQIISAWRPGMPTAEVMGRAKYVAEQKLKLSLMAAQSERRLIEMTAAGAGQAGAVAGGNFFSNFIKRMQGHGQGGVAQLVHVFRATFDSVMSGMNPWRVFLQQAPQALQAISVVGSTLIRSLMLISVPLLAVTAILGSIWYYTKRVNDLAKDMIGPMREAFSVEHIAKYLQKASTIEQLQKDITDEVRRTREAHDSVQESLQRELDLTKDRISYERQLLELQKANELAAAETPAQREAIEKKYSGLILAKNKEERDAELKHLQDLAAKLPEEIQRKKSEISGMIGGGYYSKGADERMLSKLRSDFESAVPGSISWKDYLAQLPSGGKDNRVFSAEKDRKTISELQDKLAASKAVSRIGIEMTAHGPMAIATPTFTEENAQTLKNAQERLAKASGSQKAIRDWQDSEDERIRARSRVEELRQEVIADEKRLAELGNDKKGKIADTARLNRQRDQEDLRLEQERLSRTPVPGHGGVGGRSSSLSEWERAGLTTGLGGPQIALLDIAKQHLQVAREHLAFDRSQGGSSRGNPWKGV